MQIVMRNVRSVGNGGDGVRIEGDAKVEIDGLHTSNNGGSGLNILPNTGIDREGLEQLLQRMFQSETERQVARLAAAAAHNGTSLEHAVKEIERNLTFRGIQIALVAQQVFTALGFAT